MRMQIPTSGTLIRPAFMACDRDEVITAGHVAFPIKTATLRRPYSTFWLLQPICLKSSNTDDISRTYASDNSKKFSILHSRHNTPGGLVHGF